MLFLVQLFQMPKSTYIGRPDRCSPAQRICPCTRPATAASPPELLLVPTLCACVQADLWKHVGTNWLRLKSNPNTLSGWNWIGHEYAFYLWGKSPLSQ